MESGGVMSSGYVSERQSVKKELRACVRRKKKQYTAECLSEWSLSLCRSLMSDGLWLAARVVLLYHSLPDEVDTASLLAAASHDGKTVLLPMVKGDDLELRVYDGEDSLSLGAYGIYEPCGVLFPESRYGEVDLVVVPGMAFDAYGHRLGRGKGYYDRLLPKLSKAHRTGLCFPFQMVDEVPSEPHDVRMSEVVCQNMTCGSCDSSKKV